MCRKKSALVSVFSDVCRGKSRGTSDARLRAGLNPRETSALDAVGLEEVYPKTWRVVFLDSWRGGGMHLPMGAKFGSFQIGQPCFTEL